MLLQQWAQVSSLVRELKSLMPLGRAKQQTNKQNSTTVHHHLNVPHDTVRQTTQGLVTIQGAELRVSRRDWGSQPTPTIPVQQENMKQSQEER